MDASLTDRPPASERVLEAVAEAEGVSPVDLPPLYDAIDLEDLDRLVASLPETDDAAYVSFRFEEYRVTVDGRREVYLNEVDRR